MGITPAGASRRFTLPDDIVERFRARDESAYNQLVDVAFAPLVRFAYGFLGSYDVAQDVVQTVFVRIVQHGSEFSPRASIVPYLYAAVRNASLNVLRDSNTASRINNALILEEKNVAGSSDITDIADYLDGLTERQSSALRLRFIEQRTVPEIAATLNISVTAVKNLITRALETIRARYKGEQ